MLNSQDNINMGEISSATAVKVKTPKRVLHFSDGVVEEYSEDEIDNKNEEETSVVDPKSLNWGPWMVYVMWAAGSSTLAACDYVGESLASLFGITTPKYHFEIEEYKRRQEEMQKEEEDRKGWVENTSGSSILVTKEITNNEPTPV